MISKKDFNLSISEVSRMVNCSRNVIILNNNQDNHLNYPESYGINIFLGRSQKLTE